MLTKFEVGQPFPGPVPQQESCILEMGRDGFLHVFLQFPGNTREDRRAFKTGFKTYTYLESGERAPAAYWIFNFPAPINQVELNFDARLVKQETIETYLDDREGVKNSMFFFMLNGPILSAMKLAGLDHEAVGLFRETIRRQRATEYSRADYLLTVRGLEAYRPEELCRMGKVFRHG